MAKTRVLIEEVVEVKFAGGNIAAKLISGDDVICVAGSPAIALQIMYAIRRELAKLDLAEVIRLKDH